MASAIKTGLILSPLPWFNYLCISANCPWRSYWKIGRTFSAALYFFISSLWTKWQKRKQDSYEMCRGVSLKWSNTAVKIRFCSASVCTADYGIAEGCLHLFSLFLHNTEGYSVGISAWSNYVKCKHDFNSRNAPLSFSSVLLGLQPCFDCITY